MRNLLNIRIDIKEGESLNDVIDNLIDIQNDMKKICAELKVVNPIESLTFGCSTTVREDK